MVMTAIGNAMANSVWEGALEGYTKPGADSSRYNPTAVHPVATLALTVLVPFTTLTPTRIAIRMLTHYRSKVSKHFLTPWSFLMFISFYTVNQY